MGDMQQVNRTSSQIEARNITMYPDQWAVVDEINSRFDFRNVSNALRFIINEYRQLKGLSEPSSATVVGTTTAQ